MSREEKNLELLNSYLDHELSDSDALEFAKKLAEDPSLVEELNEFHAVKNQLGRLREAKAPRKYILTRAEAAAAKKPSLLERLFPAFRISAAVSMIALIVLTVAPLLAPDRQNELLPVAKSVALSENFEAQDYSLESIAAGAVSPAADSAGDAQIESSEARPGYFSSQGVRGGSPKMEVLVSAARKFPDNRSGKSAAANESFNEERATLELNGGTNISESGPAKFDSFMVSFTVIGIIQLTLCAVLVVSLVWMMLTMAKRYSSLR